MRRQFLVLGLVLALLPLAEPASAQFFSARGLLGVVTQPLRGLLGRHSIPRHRPQVHEARPAASPQRSEQKQTRHEATAPRVPRSLKPADPQNPYELVLGYAFWPREFEKDYTGYSYRTIATAVIGASAANAPPTTVGSAAAAKISNASLPTCDIADNSASDWLTGRLESAMGPQPAQARALDELQAQLVEGTKTIRSECRAARSDSPRERLADLKARLWALHNADLIARPAIKTFYEGLTDQQRIKFKAPQVTTTGDVANMRMGQRHRMCAMQSPDETGRLVDEISKATQPNQDQQAALDNLRNRSSQMEKLLLAACARPIQSDPLARLDATDDQLVAMNLAASNLEIALNGFYGALDRWQKTAFDALGQ